MKTFSKPIPHGKLTITIKLEAINNQKPYFSVTADEYDYRQKREGGLVACGCMHERIREVFGDRFDDVIALHLADENGKPMHAAENGFYWLAGAMGGLGVQYHGANGATNRSADECLQIFADHIRVSLAQARELCAEARKVYESVPQYTRVYEGGGSKAVKAWFADYCAQQIERWQAEADAAIEKYGLRAEVAAC